MFLQEIYYFMEIFYHKSTAITKEQQQFQTHKKTHRTFPELGKQQVITSQEKKEDHRQKETSRSLLIINIFAGFSANIFAGNLLFYGNIPP
jgi:hypothetical protein